MKKKVAIYDYDKTILNTDSNVLLIKYWLKKHPLSFWRLFLVAIPGLAFLLKKSDVNKAKTAWLYPLNQMGPADIQDFCNKELKPRHYQHVLATIDQHHQAGYTVYLCSASVEAYLDYLDLPVERVIGTRTEVINGIKSGHVTGVNCKGSEKVNRINEALAQDEIEIDYENSYGYSDSTSDIPMLKMVKNRVRVSTKDGSLSQFEF